MKLKIKKNWIIGLSMLLVFIAVASAYTIKDVVVSDDIGTKIAKEAIKDKTSESEVTSNIIEAHYNNIEVEANKEEVREIKHIILQEIEYLDYVNDPIIAQNVLDAIRCEMYEECK